MIGDPDRFEHYLGPVVSSGQFEKVLGYIKVGKGEARLLLGGRPLDGEAHFKEPAILADVRIVQ